MIVKMMITFDYNPETNEYSPIKQEIVKSKTTEKSPAEKEAEESMDSSEPQITLTDNKYILNKSAAKLLDVSWEDRLDIKYQIVDKVSFPIIGKNTIWKTKSGNKLTKMLTVSYRGNANTLLAEYGDTFSLTPWQGHEGLFVMVGNKIRNNDSNIDVTESPEITQDKPNTDDIDTDSVEDSEETTIEEPDTDNNNYEINDFNFEL